MTAELDRLMKPEVDRVHILRNRDHEIGTLVSDVVGYATNEDYKRAAQAAAYLLLALAKRAGAKPFNLLKAAK